MDTRKFIEEQNLQIKSQIGNQRAIVACSGGVDSTACTILSHRAIGKRLTAVFVDGGFMREGEPGEVVGLLRSFGVRTRLLRVQRRFFKALKGKIDPERKRKVFRDTFYRVLGETVKREKAKFLIQGTIKADIVETTGGIKTQHNVLEQIGIDPGRYGLKIIEPLKTLYKPDVRRVARALGLPKEVWQRMPFPGPGLATRVVGEVTSRRVRIVRQATKIVEEELKDRSHFQVLAVLLADKATGVKKGKRAFGHIIAIRSVDSQDAITARVTKIPWPVLQKMQTRITKEIPSVVRVLYELTPKPPATIEYI